MERVLKTGGLVRANGPDRQAMEKADKEIRFLCDRISELVAKGGFFKMDADKAADVVYKGLMGKYSLMDGDSYPKGEYQFRRMWAKNSANGIINFLQREDMNMKTMGSFVKVLLQDDRRNIDEILYNIELLENGYWGQVKGLLRRLEEQGRN